MTKVVKWGKKSKKKNSFVDFPVLSGLVAAYASYRNLENYCVEFFLV